MPLVGRGFRAGSGYRYGFNGKEKDNSTGDGNLDFGSRMMDTRIGRWLSADKLFQKYPNESPYVFSGNSPLMFNDPDGNEKIVTITILHRNGSRTVLELTDKDFFYYHPVKSFHATNGNEWTHKDNMYIDYIIDVRDDNIFRTTRTVTLKTVNENYTWNDVLSDWWDGLGLKSQPRKYGLKMYGGGEGISPLAQREWERNLPKAENSDFIGSITGLLDAAAAYGDIAELSPDAGYFLESLGIRENVVKVVNTVENVISAIETADNAANPLLPKHWFNRGNTDEKNIIKPGVTYHDKETKQNYFRLNDSTNQCCATGPATDTTDHNSTKPISSRKQ